MRRALAHARPSCRRALPGRSLRRRDRRDEAAGQHQVDRREIEQRAVLGRHRETGDQRIALLVLERLRRLFPRPGLHGAGDLRARSQSARARSTLKPTSSPVSSRKLNGGIVGRGQEADGRHRREVGHHVAGARIDVIGQRLAEGGERARRAAAIERRRWRAWASRAAGLPRLIAEFAAGWRGAGAQPCCVTLDDCHCLTP